MNEKVYTNKYTNKMKNAPLFWLFLPSIGWPSAMVWGCWLSDRWQSIYDLFLNQSNVGRV
jgi:hypothetical protein